jgi:hypothetical protein
MIECASPGNRERAGIFEHAVNAYIRRQEPMNVTLKTGVRQRSMILDLSALSLPRQGRMITGAFADRTAGCGSLFSSGAFPHDFEIPFITGLQW